MRAWWRESVDTDTGYRGIDSPEATVARQLAGRMRGHAVRLVPRADVHRNQRPPLLPGKKSRRRRQNVWVRG